MVTGMLVLLSSSIGDLKSKCERYSAEIQKLETRNAKLNTDLLTKTSEVEEMRQKQDLLMKDAETFESYLNSIKSDEVAIRLIIQKIQEAYHLTREELAKTTAQYKETMKIVKEYSEHFQRQEFTAREMQSKMTELQGRVEKEMALVAELRLKESSLEEQSSNQEQQIIRLRKVVESMQEYQSVENNVRQTMSKIVEASSSWCENSSSLGNKITQLNELLQQRSVICSIHREIR